eukprot:438928_1
MTNHTLDIFITKLIKNKKITNLTGKYLSDLWHSQHGQCYYSTMPIFYNSKVDWRPNLITLKYTKHASGYKEGNVIWVAAEFTRYSYISTEWSKELIENIPNMINKQTASNNIHLLLDAMSREQNRSKNKNCVLCSNTIGKKSYLCDKCKQEYDTDIASIKYIDQKLKTSMNSAKRRGLRDPNRGIFELSNTYIADGLRKQQWRCYYSNIPLEFKTHSPWSFSPERLDNNIGYTVDNTRYICQIFNSGNRAQWNRKKMNDFLVHRFGFKIDYASE